jgi:CheY-like chemotaxis protein
MAKKILLADDSITIQKVVELTFSDGDYEITAVNNGSKAIQKLQEMRPDIILSDIIMPEKNGYEVCEFVKSNPEYKTIPVILLTGTFEPFDPDRAERAGCDAVVTKPFESQSLIHKVEELIQSAAPAAPAEPEGVPPSPFDETHSERRPEAAPPQPAAGEDEPFAETPQPSPEEIFGMSTPEVAPPPADRSGSVFDETNPPGGASQPDVAPLFGQPAQQEEPPAYSGETTAFPKMSFDDLQRLQMQEEAAAPEPPAEPEPPAAPQWSAETTAFPKMSFDDLQRMRDEAAPPAASSPEPPAIPEPLEWPTAPPPAQADGSFNSEAGSAPASASGFGFESEEPKVVPFEPPQAPSFTPPEPEPEPEPVYSGETTAFPKMSFDDLQRMREEMAPPPPPAMEELPWTSAPEPLISGAAESPRDEEPAAPSAPAAVEAPAQAGLSDADVDRIARRVVELMSEKAVRDIAWEVIPDLAQVIVRERIKELETEA